MRHTEARSEDCATCGNRLSTAGAVPYCLLPLDGGAPIVLETDDLVIGRDPDCDLTIRGCDTVSRRHCRLTRSDHYFEVVDLNSRNGVRINGHRIHEPASLKPGDTLRLGATEFVLASRSREAIEALASAVERPTDDVLGATQPHSFLEVLLDDEVDLVDVGEDAAGETTRPPAPAPERSQTPPPQPAAKRPDQPLRKSPAAKSRLKDIGQRSWDAIVAFERRAPGVRRKPPRPKKQPSPKKQSPPKTPAVVESEPVPADRAVLLGYATRAAPDEAWDHCRLGLALICWSGLAAGLLVFLTWLVPTVPALVEAMRMTAESLALPDGTRMVVLGVLPVIYCVSLREIAPALFWPTMGLTLLGLLLGQVVRPSHPGLLLAFNGIMQVGLIVACSLMLAGSCLTCFVPRRARLRVWAVPAAAGMLAFVVTISAVALAHIRQIPGLSLAVGRPPGLPLEAGLIATGVAAPLALLLLMRGIGHRLHDQPLVDSVNTCLTCVGGAGVLAATVWYLVVSRQVTGMWADVFLLVTAAGVNLTLFWTAQSAGYTRDSLR